MEHLDKGADRLQHRGLVPLVISGTEFALRLDLGKAVGLAGQMVEGLGQVLDDQPIVPGQVLILVLGDLPAGDKGVEAIKDGQVEHRVQRLEQGVLR